MIHRKCSGISVHELNTRPKNVFKHFICKPCNKNTFPHSEEPTIEILKQSFNSNFNCSCTQKSFHNLKINDLTYDDSNRFGPDPEDLVDQTHKANIEFDYYSIHDIHKMKSNLKGSSFSVFHSNIQSLSHNFDALQDLLTCCEYKFDIIGLSETWHSKNKDHNFRPGILDGYHSFISQCGNTVKAGCGLYINDNLTFTERKELDTSYEDENNEFQAKWIEIVNKKHVNTLVGVMYRHPRKASDSTFLKYLEKTLDLISKENKKIVMMGDFNYNLLQHETNKYVKDFVYLTNEYFLQPCITEPTRNLPGQRPSLIDNIFTNILDEEIISGNLTSKISDHMPNFSIFKNQHHDKNRRRITKRDFSKFSEKDYLLDISNIPLDLSQNANLMYSNYHQKLLNVLDKHAPIKTLSCRESKWRRKPWFTKGIQTAIKTKHKYYGKYLRSKKDKFWYNRYKSHKNRLDFIIKKSKQNYYKNYFENNLKNSKKIWSGINTIINKRKSKNVSDIYLSEKGTIITDQKKVSNLFNNFYTSVATTLVKKLPKPNTKYQDYLKNRNTNSIVLNRIQPEELMKLLKSLDTTKASDIYNFSPKMLKLAAPAICLPLTIIFNQCLEEGIFPDLLKVAKVIPVHKGKSTFDPSNYRPISLLPIISKLFEKLIYSRVYSFICDENILYKRQYGFQRNKSTELALLDLQSNIVDSLENKEIPCAIFLDFAKAFDTVNHEILLHKLEHYGIRGKTFDWFKSYLSNRKQCVSVNGVVSELQSIAHGVPQGSILGPLLFLLSINDITTTSDVFKFFLFADDTSLFYSGKSLKSIELLVNNELKKLSEWLTANKLTLNVDKSNFLIFKPKNASNNLSTINLTINGEKLSEKLEAKYLGIIIDNKLTFNSHISTINKKLLKGNCILAKLRHYLPKKLMKSIYGAHIQPFLDYGILLWSMASKTNLDQLSAMQDKSIKILNFKRKDDASAPLYKDSKILPLNSLINLAQSRLIWKIKNNSITTTMSELLHKHKVIINIRNPQKYVIPSRRTEIGKSFFTYQGVIAWNSLPVNILAKTTLNSFKLACKEYLINQVN